MTNRTWIALLTMAVLSPMGLEAQQDPAKIGEGAQVYAANCARCHNARSGTEHPDLAWVAIVGHMRARANLTKTQAQSVLAFLQATNLPPVGGGAAAASASANGAASPPSVVVPEGVRVALLGLLTGVPQAAAVAALEPPAKAAAGGAPGGK